MRSRRDYFFGEEKDDGDGDDDDDEEEPFTYDMSMIEALKKEVLPAKRGKKRNGGGGGEEAQGDRRIGRGQKVVKTRKVIKFFDQVTGKVVEEVFSVQQEQEAAGAGAGAGGDGAADGDRDQSNGHSASSAAS